MTPTTSALRRPRRADESTVSPRSRSRPLRIGAAERARRPRRRAAYASERLTPWNSVPSTSRLPRGVDARSRDPASIRSSWRGGRAAWPASERPSPRLGHRLDGSLDRARHARPAALLDREALRLDGEVAREGLVDLVVDRPDEARRHRAVDDHDHESPIVSATAVAAVRSGLERSESAASRPPVGSSRRSGTASQRMTGRMMNGAAAAMPANIAIVSQDPADRPPGQPVSLSPPNQNEPPNQTPGTNRARPMTSRALRGTATDLRVAEHRADGRDRARRAVRARTRRAASRRCR